MKSLGGVGVNNLKFNRILKRLQMKMLMVLAGGRLEWAERMGGRVRECWKQRDSSKRGKGKSIYKRT